MPNPHQASRSSLPLRFGTFLMQLCDSRRRVIVASLVTGAAAGAVEFAVHRAIRMMSLPNEMHGALDAASVAVAVTVGIGALLLAARERRKRVLQQVARVAELNHQVRNALQVIVHSQYVADSRHTAIVLESVERIERTLKELFPVPRDRQD